MAVRGSAKDRRAAEAQAQGRGDLRDRLRAVGAAAHRHVRRGRAHHDGAPRVPRAHRRQGQDAADRVLRRHGRPAQGPGQRAEQGDARGASRQAAHAGAGPVLERISLVRRAQQCAAARLPRPLRLRLRIHVLDRLLHVGPLRCRAAHCAAAPRRGDGDHAAVAARGARADLFAVPADLDPKTGVVLQVPILEHDANAGTITYEEPDTKRAHHDAGDRRQGEAAMEARLGDALGRARHRLRDGRQGPDRVGEALRRDRARARRRAAGGLQLRALPRREGPEDLQVEGQRPDHRRVAALRRRRESCRCSCITSRRRRSASTST